MNFSLTAPDRPAARRAFAPLICTLAAGIIVGSAASLPAALTWKETTVELTPEAKVGVVEARFRFSNDGKAPVDIKQIHASCGCTTVELPQRHFEPGQGGEIVVNYTIGDHVGLQRKSIMVTTSDEPEATVLTIVAHVPELIHLEQTFVAWKKGEAVKAKTIPITLAPDAPKLDEISVQSSNTSVSAVLQPVDGGKGYDLQVTPGTTDKPALATLIVRYRIGSEEKTFRAYATVEQGAAAPRAPVTTVEPIPSPSPAS